MRRFLYFIPKSAVAVKVSSLLLSLMVSVSAVASSNPYFEALGGAMNVGCRLNFSLKGCDRNQNEVISGEGTLLILGECYKASVSDEMEVTCNGDLKSITRHDIKEVMISKNDRSSRDLLENPLQIIRDAYSQYQVSFGKDNCVTLTSKDKRSLYPQIKIWFKSGSGSCRWIPTRFTLKGKDKSVYTIDITQFTSPVQFDKSVFNVDIKKKQGYQIVDLR